MKSITNKLESIQSIADINQAMQYALNAHVKGKKQKIEVVIKNQETATEARRDIQNKLQFHWLKEIDQQKQKIEKYPINSAGELRAFCKLKFGVAIMIEDDDFRKSWLLSMGHLNYRTKLKIIEDLEIPITRLMTINQMARYLTDLKQFWNQLGVELTDKEDIEQTALGRYKTKPNKEDKKQCI